MMGLEDIRRERLAADLLRNAPTMRSVRDEQVLAILTARSQGEMTALKQKLGLTWPQFNEIRDQLTPQARRVAERHGIPFLGHRVAAIIREMQR